MIPLSAQLLSTGSGHLSRLQVLSVRTELPWRFTGSEAAPEGMAALRFLLPLVRLVMRLQALSVRKEVPRPLADSAAPPRLPPARSEAPPDATAEGGVDSMATMECSTRRLPPLQNSAAILHQAAVGHRLSHSPPRTRSDSQALRLAHYCITVSHSQSHTSHGLPTVFGDCVWHSRYCRGLPLWPPMVSRLSLETVCGTLY